ncbi:MAG: hypothetical protein GY835_19885 [bacterium]|nr:hypothetical protein [bacterium]
MFTALGAELDQALPAPAGEVVEVAPEGVHVLGADGCGAVVIGIAARALVDGEPVVGYSSPLARIEPLLMRSWA